MICNLQIAVAHEPIPTRDEVQSWVRATLAEINRDGEVTVRVVDEKEMRDLNFRYRKKNSTTNVLSFPFDAAGLSADATADNFLGDIIICAPIVAAEATSQNLQPMQHWAHMIIHGVLHLCGYDHENNSDANIMETLEKKILLNLNF